MGKPTPIYSAFAIVSIESLWPSSEGDEVPINYQDLVYLNERLTGGSEEFQARQRDLSGDLSSKEAEMRQKEDAFANIVTNDEFYNFTVSGSVKQEPIIDDNNVPSASDFIRITEITFSATKPSRISGNSREKIQKLNSTLRANTNTLNQLENFSGETNRRKLFSGEFAEESRYKEKLTEQIEKLTKLFNDNNKTIEEINTLGNEIDAISKEILDKSAYGTYPQSSRRPEFSSILNSEDAFKKRRGYFKIIPLNVVKASTATSTGGTVGQSSFNISFTMDDVLIIADKFGAAQVENRLPSAIPIKIDEVFNEINLRNFEQTINQTVIDEIRKFGLYSFRISGNDFTFNVEDIIEANDTVTVWFYHDPKEFDFVGDVKDSEGEKPVTLDKFVFNKDFSFVLGSASRKSQDDFKLLNEDNSIFKKPPRTRVQDILVKTGILNQFSTPEQLADENFQVDTSSLTNAQVFDFLLEVGKRSNLDTLVSAPDGSASNSRVPSRDSIDTKLSLSRGVSEIILGSNSSMENLLSDLLLNVYRPDIKGFNNNVATISNTSESIREGLGISERELKGLPETRLSYQNVSNQIIASVKGVLNTPGAEELTADDLTNKWVDSFGGTSLQNGAVLQNVISRAEIKDLFQTIISYKPSLGILTNEALSFMKDQNSNELITPPTEEQAGFFAKRTLLKTKSHGETPYLALKGHISSVEVNYGASQGSNIVTITGAGYEKILNDNIVYYEDLFSPTGGTFGQAVEAYPIYSQMLPPKAMLSFIEANAPRFILIGKPSRQTIDARNMSLRFARATKAEDFDVRTANNDSSSAEKPEVVENVVSKYFDSETNQSLVRGLASIDINIVLREGTPVRSEGQTESDFQIDEDVGLRIFYPVNYLNTSRIREMINSLETAYEQNPDEAVIKIPIKIAPMQSISNNLLAFNGPKEVNHLFVDETGRLRQRLAYEAWERPPAPEYTPTITDNEILISGSSFSRNSDSVTTMVDIRASYLTTAQGIVDARFAGRTLSGGNDYIPLTVINADNFDNRKLLGEDSNFYEVISEPFFRYGMKYRLLNDIYTSSTRVAKRKSILYQGFFSKPLKTAKLALRNNTSYRAGETVLVCLDSYRYRSREVIDVEKTLNWLKYLNLKDNEELIPLYIGVDKRWVNHDSYFLTSNLDNSREYSYFLSSFKENPEKFILDAFINTFEIISNTLGRLGQTKLQFITPEYFPTTLWAASVLNSPISSNIRIIYSTIFDKLIGGSKSDFDFDKILKDFPDIFNYVRMQNFKATSYYIESVQHSYVHGEAATTNLNLNHGQDNLVLLEPFSMKPIGFMSTERRMRIGYDDVVIKADGTPVFENQDKNTRDRLLWENFEDKKLSDLQVTYIEQFKQDKAFKENSFLYTAQKYRNSSNFMYELALELGLAK